MLCFVVKNTQNDKNMKEIVEKKPQAIGDFFSFSTGVASSLPELFLTDSWRFLQLFLSKNSTHFPEIFAFIF